MAVPHVLRRSLRWAALALLFLLVAAIGAFGLLQTPLGLGWAARTVAGLVSSPGFSVTLHDLDGTVPFDMRVRSIEISDDRGVWLALDNAHIELAAGDLLRGRVHIEDLSAGRIEVARPPESAVPAEPVALAERLRLPRLPVAVRIDRLSVDRIALGPAILGEPVAVAIAGRAVADADQTEITLDLHRIDNVPGNIAVALRQSGGLDPVLAVRIEASEPTGLLLGRMLGRADRPPLTASLIGEGRLADWHGELTADAGQLAQLRADIAITAIRDTAVSIRGNAAIAKLLPLEVAALAGENIPITARVSFKESGAVSLDALALEMAAGRLTADLALGNPDRTIAGHVRADLPQLASTSRLLGQPVHGSAKIEATISGTEARPDLHIEASGDAIGVASSGVEHAEGRVTVGWTGNPSDPAARIAVKADGRLRGIAMPAGAPSDLGRDLDWSLAATAAPDGSAAELTDFTARGAGIDLAGTGKAGRFGRELEGRLRLAVADLRPFTGMLGQPVDGALSLEFAATQPEPDRVVATVEGSIDKLRGGPSALNALAGGSVAISGSAQREPSGLLRLDKLTVGGTGFNLNANGTFDPATQLLAAVLDAEIRDLRPTGASLGTAISGRVSANVAVDGRLDHPRVRARVEGNDVAAGAAALDRVRLDAEIPDAAAPRVALTGNFRSGGLDGALALEAEQGDAGEVAIRRLQLKAADGVVGGDLRIDLRTLLARGAIAAKIPDLAPWSRLAGMPLSGRLDLKANLDARSGQGLDLTLDGDRLSSGAGGARVSVAHVGITARLGDLLGTPSGTARANLAGVGFASGGLTNAAMTLDTTRPGRFTFGAEAKGKVIEPLTIALSGTAEASPGALEIQVSKLSGALGPDRFQLTRPLTLAKRGGDLALTGLALSVGSGQVSGNASRRGAALAADITARDLPLAMAGRLAGHGEVGGTLTADLNVGGTVGAPHGRFSLSGQNLRFALPRHQHLPTVGLDLAGTWNGRELALNGKVSGLKGDRLELSGSAPLLLTPALAVTVPPQGRLALRLQGAGELGNLADLLPLGEDRVTGKFALDASITGTPAAPAASGQMTLTDGRYENFATGAVLTKMRLALAGDRDRITLREFSAGDSANGNLSARGSVVLGGTGPTADVAVTLQKFRVVGRDQAVLAASGTVAITGAVASPKVVARLTTDEGDLSIPDNLPPSVTTLQVVEVNSRAPKRPAAPAKVASAKVAAAKVVPTKAAGAKVAAAKPSAPALPASLDVKIDVPGRIFVRGRGLDSEWRGRIAVTGTSDAPHIVGSLSAIRGTFDFLGKTFKVARGNIAFDGATAIDPTLDIVAEIAAADITAQVLVSGPASSPKVAITSSPVVPQDEILSRVLFGRTLGQITAAEGIQVAQAAATLAGGGPGVLDRLRGRLGLDRLVFGSAPTGMASSNLNPAAGGSSTSGTSISGGKYVADGVYVGATQGLTPQSSKVIVEIEVRPHVTVQGDFSQSGGSGLGLNYKYDY